MAFTDATVQSMLETEFTGSLYMTLHDAQPDSSGSNRIAGAVETCTFAWNAGTGRFELQADVTFTSVTDPTHFGVWVGDPDAAGVFKGSGAAAVTGTTIDVILTANTTYLDIV